jgi:hypothetical protein
LVIHADDAGSPGPVIGYSPVVDGENANVVVEVDPAQATAVLYAMLHTDAGTAGTYEFPGEDGPVMVDGQVVTPAFNVIAAMMEEGAAAEGEATDDTGATMEGDQMMAAMACQADYVVQADDWLSKIAEKFYGNVLSFPAIVDATNAQSKAMMEGEAAMAETPVAEETTMEEEATMAEGKLVLQGADGAMMDVTLDAEGKLMVSGADGAMMEVTMGEDGALMMADGSMVDGKLMMTDASGAMMDVTMDAEGKMMVTGADGTMMEVKMGEDGAMMMAEASMEEGATEEGAMAESDETMAEDAMMSGYATIDNPDVIEIGWTLCIPSLEDAQKMLPDILGQ